MKTLLTQVRVARWIVLLAVLALLAGCVTTGPPPTPTPQTTLRVVAEDDWPLLLDDLDARSFFQAAESSLGYLRKVSPDKRFTFGPYQMSAAQMAAMLEDLKDLLYRQPDPVSRSEALQQKYALLESVGRDGRGEVLMTGYYEPVLKAPPPAPGLVQVPGVRHARRPGVDRPAPVRRTVPGQAPGGAR